MKTLNHLKNYYVVVLALMFFAVGFKINRNLSKPYIVIAKQDESLNLNDEMIQKFNLGFKRLESSLLWISTILESDIDHYKKKDLNSWMFLRFNTISKLEPKFYENYAFGGLYLSIIKDDLAGASIIYDKGLKIYPNDFFLLKDAAFHYYFEVGDFDKSYELYSKLKNHPKSNPILISNLARLESERGNLEASYSMLIEQYKRYQKTNSFIAEKIHEHLYSIKAEIDLSCLNQDKHKFKKCDLVDFDQELYLLSNNKYSAKKKWVPYRVKSKAPTKKQD